MYKRLEQKHLTDLLDQFAAVVLLGPRQTGKTTMAFEQKDAHANALYLDLELPSAQRQLEDPEAHFIRTAAKPRPSGRGYKAMAGKACHKCNSGWTAVDQLEFPKRMGCR